MDTSCLVHKYIKVHCQANEVNELREKIFVAKNPIWNFALEKYPSSYMHVESSLSFYINVYFQ